MTFPCLSSLRDATMQAFSWCHHLSPQKAIQALCSPAPKLNSTSSTFCTPIICHCTTRGTALAALSKAINSDGAIAVVGPQYTSVHHHCTITASLQSITHFSLYSLYCHCRTLTVHASDHHLNVANVTTLQHCTTTSQNDLPQGVVQRPTSRSKGKGGPCGLWAVVSWALESAILSTHHTV